MESQNILKGYNQLIERKKLAIDVYTTTLHYPHLLYLYCAHNLLAFIVIIVIIYNTKGKENQLMI